MSWEKLPAVAGSISILHIGTNGSHAIGALSDLAMERVIAVGFGSAGATRDGDSVYSESDDEDAFCRVADIEEMAAKDPDHDWRIYFYAPLYEAEYQRHGAGQWVLIKKGEGFA